MTDKDLGSNRQGDLPTAREVMAVLASLKTLLDHVDLKTCQHDETHRGGVIWTICDGCGRQWADDEGGFVPYSDPPAVAQARKLLDAVQGTTTASSVGTKAIAEVNQNNQVIP